jgi:hypothetical protein
MAIVIVVMIIIDLHNLPIVILATVADLLLLVAAPRSSSGETPSTPSILKH